MKKKLPGIYHDKTMIKKNNNRSVFYSSQSNLDDNVLREVDRKRRSKNENNYNHIITTLNALFSSSHHVFLIPVEIITKDNTYDTKIIYRDSSKISTVDGDTINLHDIIDIKIKKSQ